MDIVVNDPTLASFYEPPHKIAAYEAMLTQDGEIRLIPIDRAAVHEDAPLKIDVKKAARDDE